MSRPSSDSAVRSRRQESVSATPIILIDRTKLQYDSDEARSPVIDEAEFDTPVSPTKSFEALSPKWTRSSLRGEIAKRKWARYQETQGTDRKLSQSIDGAVAEASSPNPTNDDADASARWGESKFQRGRRRAREAKDTALGRKPTNQQKTSADATVDILYENQRGSFFCGLPLFSSKSLLNFDPPAWVDAEFKPSAVDITNAQVPDPSWDWDWRTWYVDMSRDVDEEGWEYSFWFLKGFSWHGTHPWFHSFVRRRRWLRKRIRTKHRVAQDKAHALNPDYFTIHASRAKSPASSVETADRRASSQAPSSGWGAKGWLDQEEEQIGIQDIGTLLKALRKSAIDREKIFYMKVFLDQGEDEIFYLADQMKTIMSLLVFQNSRRQLLSLLMRKFDDLSSHREEREERGDAEDEDEDDDEKRRMDNLLSAVKAADEQCRKLEYWSDVRDILHEDDSTGATRNAHRWGHEGAGVDARGSDPDAAEHGSNDENGPRKDEKGKGRALGGTTEEAPATSTSWIDGTSEQQPRLDTLDIVNSEEEQPGRLSEDIRREEQEGKAADWQPNDEAEEGNGDARAADASESDERFFDAAQTTTTPEETAPKHPEDKLD